MCVCACVSQLNKAQKLFLGNDLNAEKVRIINNMGLGPICSQQLDISTQPLFGVWIENKGQKWKTNVCINGGNI